MVQIMDNKALDIVLALPRGKAHIRELTRSLNTSHSTVLREAPERCREIDSSDKAETKGDYL